MAQTISQDTSRRSRKDKAKQQQSAPPQQKPHLTALVDRLHEKELTYDLDAINQFLDVIFHAGQDDIERSLVWLGIPRMPIRTPVNEESALKHLSDTNKPYHCYYCTSTTAPEASGRLSHKKANFVTWRVLVLDDIGTKISVSALPEELRTPTYIIESSPNNYQYGYVWKNPIESLAEAEAFLQIVAMANISDKGGLMPVKAVRLPCGVNGKRPNPDDGYDRGVFEVRLVEIHPDRLWEPDQILKTIESRADWKEIQRDSQAAARRVAHSSMGASLWSEAVNPSSSGIIDPVLEWLDEGEEVKGDTGDFVNIECPWGHEHSNGDTTAGYRPLGRGDAPNTRAFHCFHDSCQTRTTADFLAHVAAQGGPQGGVVDYVADLTSTWIFDVVDNQVWKIRGGKHIQNVTVEAFSTHKCRTQKIVQADGTVKHLPRNKLWKLSPARVDVYGQVLDPTTTSRLVYADNHLRVNTYTPPDWKRVNPNPIHVKRFVDFLEYLIPGEDERNYFIDWLAAKVQNMGFRGAAIMMVARNQGTGRNTLADMITRMLDQSNCQMVTLRNMLHDNFNEWQEAPMVFVEEVQTKGEEVTYNTTYERLKELVDVRPKKTTINPKYGKRRETMVYSSYLLFTNHTTALTFPENDRRLFILENAIVPAPDSYFDDLNAWLDADEWPVHVWNWLLDRQVSMSKLTSPPRATAMKELMAGSAQNPVEAAVAAVLHAWPSSITTPAYVYAVLDVMADDISLYEHIGWEATAKKLLRAKLLTLGKNAMLRDYNGKSKTLYLILPKVDTQIGKLAMQHRANIKQNTDIWRKMSSDFKSIDKTQIAKIAAAAKDHLTSFDV